MIREERIDEAAKIGALTTAAFHGKPYAGGNEAEIIDRLRTGGALSLSLVEVEGETLRGHLAASPALLGGESGWAAIGPISVHPDLQGRGLGSSLMQAALTHLNDGGTKGVVLVGDPAFYTRFSFAAHDDLSSRGIPQEYVLGLGFGQNLPRGRIAFHDAFRPA